MIRVYAGLAGILVLLALLAGVYGKGRSDGRAVQAAEYAQERATAHAQAEAERAALQAALDARTAELARKSEEVAHAVAQVRVEYLPGKTLVKREIVERAVFRECRTGDRVRDTINSALAGRPVPGAADVGTETGRLPADA